MQPPIPLGITLQGRYHIIGVVEQEMPGRTYIAEDLKRFNERCALQEFMPVHSEAAAIEEIRECFQQEAAILYNVQHPQIPRYRVMIAYEQRLLLVQEYVEGKTYRALLKERQAQGYAFAEVEVLQLLWQLLPILLHLHRQGIIHGNISPDSILIRQRDGVPLLTNFGLLQNLATELELCQVGAAHPRTKQLAYAPKEQLETGKLYRNSDLYAIAATAVVLLTGRDPQELYHPRKRVWAWEKWVVVSPAVAAILNRMLEPKPQRRYPSVSQVIRALQVAMTGVASAAISPSGALARPSIPTQPVRVSHRPAFSSGYASLPSAGFTSGEATALHDHFWEHPVVLAAIGAGVALISGVVGWSAFNTLRHNPDSPKAAATVAASPASSSRATTTPTSAPSVGASKPSASPQRRPISPQQEQAIQAALRDRRRTLGISYKYFVELVDEVFYAQHPELKAQRLDTGPDEEALRTEWSAIAEDLMNKLETLNAEARDKLSHYRQEDYNRWVIEINRYNLSSATLAELTDARFYYLFPILRGKSLNPENFGQVWYAIAESQLEAIRSGNALEILPSGAQTSSQQVHGTLKPGEGRVYSMYLEQGQTLRLNLKSPHQSLSLSVHPPTIDNGTPALVNRSSKPAWSSTLAQSGYYEIVVVSNALDPVSYQLSLNSKLIASGN